MECEDCGGKTYTNRDGFQVCPSCNPRTRPHISEMAEDVDREPEDEDRSEFRDAYLRMLEENQ